MSDKIKLRDGDTMLIMVRDGEVIHFTPNMGLPHSEFVKRATGQLPEGAWVGSVSKLDGEIAAITSKHFFGYRQRHGGACSELPAPASCGPDERMVRVPRRILISAKRDIPEHGFENHQSRQRLFYRTIAKEREEFASERKDYVEKLMTFNRKVGKLETKLLQLEDPQSTNDSRRIHVVSERDGNGSELP